MRPSCAWLPILVLTGCRATSVGTPVAADPEKVRARERKAPNKVMAGALKQLERPASYDDSYSAIGYPDGDVASDRGACADVIVRAYRYAGIDLQSLIHEDSRSGAYPRIRHSDKNIDHRRVLNQEVFFRRHGKSLTTVVSPETLGDWMPGDVVSWRLFGGRTHIGIVSDLRRADGVPLVIHNIGRVAEDDSLTRWEIAGHFRYKPGAG